MIVVKIMNFTAMVSLMVIYNIAIMQIVSSRGKLNRHMSEQERLFNQMHEGLVVIS